MSARIAALVSFAFLSVHVTILCAGQAQPRPNIVWIFVDDVSVNFSCYGETAIQTPNVDRLAREGTRFSRAFVTAPVCSPCRSALITGCYQTTIGAHHHRSGRGVEKIHLPAHVEPAPALFQRAGYYTCISGPLPADGKPNRRLGKTDYNFEWDKAIYDSADPSGRKPGQPFFLQVELHGGKYRGANQAQYDQWAKRVFRELGSNVSTGAVVLPPYYPRDPVILEDWARYLDSVRYTDKEVGDVVARLEREGILDQTIVCFMTDHGISHARGSSFCTTRGFTCRL
jgi:arylsulfatase A-like enzyme